MNGEAIEQLRAGFQKPTEVGGFIASPDDWSVRDPAELIKPGPTPMALNVGTLGAVRDYVAANKDGLDLTRLVAPIALTAARGPAGTTGRARPFA